MTTFIVRRFLTAVILVFMVALTVFLLGHMTGDPVRLLLPEDATQADIEAMRERLGFDRPLPVQFVEFVVRAVQGDLGTSLRYRRPAIDLVLQRMPATIELSVAAMAIALLVAIPSGVISALRPGSLADTITSTAAVVGQALPPFWIGIMLIIVFAVWLPWLPAAGREAPGSLVLPAVTLGLWPMARLARVFRSSLLDVMHEDYVRTARAKGLSRVGSVDASHDPERSDPRRDDSGSHLRDHSRGTVVTESVFAWPGIGRLALDAVY